MWTFCSRSSRAWRFGGLVGIALAAWAVAAVAAGPDPCLECHGVPGFGTAGRPRWVLPEAYRAGVHGRLACGDCHKGAEVFPHPEPKVRCDLPCHVPDASHAELAASEASGAHARIADPPCLACHGGAARPENPDDPCLGCHAEVEAPVVRYPDTPGAFGARAHREARSRAPGCTDCHGVHGVAAGEEARAACAAAACHPGAPPGFSALFDHRRDPAAPVWGGARPALAWAGLAVGLVLVLHALGGRRP